MPHTPAFEREVKREIELMDLETLKAVLEWITKELESRNAP